MQITSCLDKDSTLATEVEPSANGRATITKRASAKKVTRKRPKAKKGIYCPICEEGPFRSLSIHNGKAQNRATHLGASAKAESKITNKYGKIVDDLVDKWFDEALAYTGESRKLLILCARELLEAFSK